MVIKCRICLHLLSNVTYANLTTTPRPTLQVEITTATTPCADDNGTGETQSFQNDFLFSSVSCVTFSKNHNHQQIVFKCNICIFPEIPFCRPRLSLPPLGHFQPLMYTHTTQSTNYKQTTSNFRFGISSTIRRQLGNVLQCVIGFCEKSVHMSAFDTLYQGANWRRVWWRCCCKQLSWSGPRPRTKHTCPNGDI